MRVLFKNKIYLINFIVMTVLWTVSSFNYFLISFQMKYIEGNIFLNTATSTLSEVIAYLLSGLVLKKFDVKKSFVSACMLSVGGSLLIIFIKPEDVSQIAYAFFVLTTKFGISGTFNMVYIATANYFPPAILGSIFGYTNLIAKGFTFFAPEIAEAPVPWPMVTFGSACLLAAISTLFLTEHKKIAERGSFKSKS